MNRFLPSIYSMLIFVGFICFGFLSVKAITTGLWWDEAIILEPVASLLAGNGWRALGVLFHEGISTGPALLIPALALSFITQGVYPPVLHLFALSHIFALIFGWKKLGADLKTGLGLLSAFLLINVFSPHLWVNHFLGEFPGSVWFLLGAWHVATPEKTNKKTFLAGIFFCLALLSKFIYLIPLFGFLLSWLILSESKRINLIRNLMLGALCTYSFWFLFQFQQYGNWEELKIGFSRWINLILSGENGAGFKQAQHTGLIKPFDMIYLDLKGLMFSGLAPALVLPWMVIQLRHLWGSLFTGHTHQHRASPYLAFGCLALLSWWLLISRFQQGGALLRHISPMLWIGMGALLLDTWRWFEKNQHLHRFLIQKKSVTTPSLIFLSALLTLFLVKKSYPYLYEAKGLGQYSAWQKQRQVRDWIRKYGLKDQPIPILDCAKNHDAWYGNVLLPQQVLSPRTLFIPYDRCQLVHELGYLSHNTYLIGMEANNLPNEKKSRLHLIEGTWDEQGLYQIEISTR